MSEPVFDPNQLRPVRRVRYFEGRLLSAADFEQDQQYHRDMRYLVNRALGYGIVEGLDVHATSDGVTVSPGFAVDAYGRELVLAQPLHVAVDDALLSACPNPVATATWGEIPVDALPTTDPATRAVEFASWLEQPTISIEPAETVAPPTLVLAGIRRRRNGLVIVAMGRETFRLRPGVRA